MLNGSKIPQEIGNLKNLIGLNNLKELSFLSVNFNQYTFQAIVPFIQLANAVKKTYSDLILSPQRNIPIYRHEEKLAVSPGRLLSNNTFKWYKTDLELVATIKVDSTYTLNTNGKYYVEVTNLIATGVTLSSITGFMTVPPKNTPEVDVK